MRIGMIMPRYAPGSKPYMQDVVAILGRWRAHVEVIHPGERLLDLAEARASSDLFVLKAKTDAALSLAGALHAAGANMLNSYPASMALRDRIVNTRVLQRAGVPVPESYLVSRAHQLAPLLKSGPLIVKPVRGSRGEGIRVIHEASELREIPAGAEPIFAQRYYKPDGRDRKIYAIGGRLFCVERPWPAHTLEEKLGRLIALSPALRETALRCGRAFGIDLFGVDIIESKGQPYVVDMSSFPGFKGVPEAALRLAEYIYAAASRPSPQQQSRRAAETIA